MPEMRADPVFQQAGQTGACGLWDMVTLAIGGWVLGVWDPHIPLGLPPFSKTSWPTGKKLGKQSWVPSWVSCTVLARKLTPLCLSFLLYKMGKTAGASRSLELGCCLSPPQGYLSSWQGRAPLSPEVSQSRGSPPVSHGQQLRDGDISQEED